jgi:hypothetical protein
VFPTFREGASTELQPIGAGDRICRLIEAPCVVNASLTREIVDRWAALVSRVPGYSLTFGALNEAARVVDALLRAP